MNHFCRSLRGAVSRAFMQVPKAPPTKPVSLSCFEQSKRSQASAAYLMALPFLSILAERAQQEREKKYQPPCIDVVPPLVSQGVDRFEHIIVGGGTAGCTLAYTLAKWMEEQGLPGKVLLLERGEDHSPSHGPDPRMSAWYDVWSEHAVMYESFDAFGGHYPIAASDHKGLGGCGTHDTRITFMPRDEQIEAFARTMHWSIERTRMYIQAALDMIPLLPACLEKEPFYEAVIQALTQNKDLQRANAEDEFKAQILSNTIAYVSVAMYQNEKRWSSAHLLNPAIRPKNLCVVTRAEAEKIIFQSHLQTTKKAAGILVRDADGQMKVGELTQDGNIVIAAGAIGTPALLQRSGIGPKHVLEKAGVPVLVENDEVGHGADHIEVPVTYAWRDAWKNPDGSLPKGGAMAWPLVIFAALDHLQGFLQAHFGIAAPPYTSETAVVATPNNVAPHLNGGFRVEITGPHANQPPRLIHTTTDQDRAVLRQGVRKIVRLFNILEKAGVVGERLSPPPSEFSLEDDAKLDAWISENIWTVYHWAATCKAGLGQAVADEHFRVRINSKEVFDNLYVASAAALPNITEANPHFTITAMSLAVADELLRKTSKNKYTLPQSLAAAAETLKTNNNQFHIRRPGEENPKLGDVVAQYADRWQESHSQ